MNTIDSKNISNATPEAAQPKRTCGQEGHHQAQRRNANQ